jgi:predicted metal-binding membrane protein
MDLMWRMMAPQAAGPYLLAAATMWLVMMIAMMIPAVLPLAGVFHALASRRGVRRYTLLFATGYLLAWSAFALLGAGLQWGLHLGGWLHGHVLGLSASLMGVVLLAAGVYQLTPLKRACLEHCRGPLGFLLERWRDGAIGALRMGLDHGLYCIGCCWVLMLLMFAGGVMSVPTMALVCAFILAERLLPGGPWVSSLPGLALIVGGIVLLVV